MPNQRHLIMTLNEYDIDYPP